MPDCHTFKKYLPPMKKLESYLNDIHHHFPKLNIFSIQKIGEGDNSVAFEINGIYIFRFPKREEVKYQLEKEIEMLPKIRQHLSFAIPEFKFISPTLSFAGHVKITGIPLSNKRYYSLGKKYQVSVQHSLAEFLKQLHHIPLPELQNRGLDIMNLKEEYSDNFFNAKQSIYPNISENKRNIISHLFNAYLNEPANFNYEPALIHNDLSKDHILSDPSTGHLSGIIDFGDAAIGDPDYDFMYLFDEFGNNFLHGILNNNQHQNIMSKLLFFTLGNRVQILLKAVEDDNAADIKNGYDKLNAWFKKYDNKEFNFG